jgi:hypothetical protein
MFARHLPLVTRHCFSGGQGRIRTSVDRKGRQIYSLLLLTAQPPVQVNFRGRHFPAEVSLLNSSLISLGLSRTTRKYSGVRCPSADGCPRPFILTLRDLEKTPLAYIFLSPSPASRLLWPAQTGAGEGIRTPDPLITNQMLYQLSYASRRKLFILEIRNSNCKPYL